MKTIKSSKEITTLEVGDKVIFGNLEYSVRIGAGYFLHCYTDRNDKIFELLNISKKDFIKNLGIHVLPTGGIFPEIKSLEALTAIVSALFKEYEKQNEFPKTWEEFCKKYYLQEDETFINSTSKLLTVEESFGRRFRLCEEDKNLCTSKQEAEAFLALMQLRQLRKAYVKDWEPDWTNNTFKYCIDARMNTFGIESWSHMNHSFSFPTKELAEQFLNNFKDLLEIAKPLL